jgi:hypothetical protein
LPVAVQTRTTSPETIVSTGFSVESKKPRWTVDGDGFSSWIFSALCAAGAARRRAAVKAMAEAGDVMVGSWHRWGGPDWCPVEGAEDLDVDAVDLVFTVV